MLSHMNLAEFTFDDARHGLAAGSYLDSLFPNLFFSDFDPFRVMKSELGVMVGSTTESPAGDPETLRLFAEHTTTLSRPSIRAWFEAVHADRVSLATLRNEMAQAFLDGLRELRTRFEHEPGFAKTALHDIRTSDRPRSTQALIRAVLYRLRNDQKLALTLNDAIDFEHCIVPAAYGDFVLLDGAWFARLKDASEFLRRFGVSSRIASPFSQKDGGIENFLQALESLVKPSK